MNIYPYEKKYGVQIAVLLNDFLPFEPETADTVDQAGGIRYIAVNELDEVVGYIAGYEILDFNKEFPYFHEELQSLKGLVESGISYYTSHFVVHPNERKKELEQSLYVPTSKLYIRLQKRSLQLAGYNLIQTAGQLSDNLHHRALNHLFICRAISSPIKSIAQAAKVFVIAMHIFL